MMRWAIFATLVVLLSAGLTIALNQSGSDPMKDMARPIASGVDATGPQPKVTLPEIIKHEFGAMSQFKTGTHDFLVKNDGKSDLVIGFVSATCKCTVSNIKEGVTVTVKPGETTPIQLRWETKDQKGPFGQEVVLRTNDPKQPQIAFQIHGEVYPAIATVPETLAYQLGRIPHDKPQVLSILMFSADYPELAVKGIDSPLKGRFTFRTEPMTEAERKSAKIAQGGLRLAITLEPGLALGDFNHEARILTNHPERDKISVYLTGRVEGPITPTPERVRMLKVVPEQGASRDVIVSVRSETEISFQVKTPKNVIAVIQPETTAASTGSTDGSGGVSVATPGFRRYVLKVTIPPGVPPGEIRGEIELTTSHPEVPILKIPVLAIVDPPAINP